MGRNGPATISSLDLHTRRRDANLLRRHLPHKSDASRPRRCRPFRPSRSVNTAAWRPKTRPRGLGPPESVPVRVRHSGAGPARVLPSDPVSAANKPLVQRRSRCDPGVGIGNCLAEIDRNHVGGGFLLSLRLGAPVELVPFLTRADQTLAQFGFDEAELLDFARRAAASGGIDRIVAHWAGAHFRSILGRLRSAGRVHPYSEGNGGPRGRESGRSCLSVRHADRLTGTIAS